MTNLAAISTCDCDGHPFPAPLHIRAGLSRIHRQIGAFDDFRHALLRALRSRPALASLRADVDGDLGVMLLEMFAYTADVLSFYDETIAHEAYLRTARRPVSVRRLAALLGYRPRPAVAASVSLALKVDGNSAVTIPRGARFLSGGADPQTFELDDDVVARPALNQAELVLPRNHDASRLARVLWAKSSVRIAAGTPVLIEYLPHLSDSAAKFVTAFGKVNEEDERSYWQARFDSPAEFTDGSTLAQVDVLVPTASAPVRRSYLLPIAEVAASQGNSLASANTASLYAAWQSGAAHAATIQIEGTLLPKLDTAFELDAEGDATLVFGEVLRNVHAGQRVILQKGRELRWFRVLRSREVPIALSLPGISGLVARQSVSTQLVLDGSLNAPHKRGTGSVWRESEREEIVLWYGLTRPGELVAPPRRTLAQTDPLELVVDQRAPLAGVLREEALLEDDAGRGVDVRGVVDWGERRITLDPGEGWAPALQAPVRVFGNVARASRGQTVRDEVLGDGDQSTPSQAFKLSKKPLTFLPSAASEGPWRVASTVELRVDQVLWREVPSFFAAGPHSRVFIVREDDDGEFWVIGGDGERGARFPTGSGNVVATYRFGAGSRHPGVGAINQVAEPVPRLASVRNPIEPGGGADHETIDDVRESGPASALTLGRAISLADIEAIVRGTIGVRATRAGWHWDERALAAVAVVWYIGADAIESSVSDAVAGAIDPSLHVMARPARALPTRLAVDVAWDPARRKQDVLADVHAALFAPEQGLLTPERIGIGGVIYRSRIFQVVQAVEGVSHVRSLQWNGRPFLGFGQRAPVGRYFDFSPPHALQLSLVQVGTANLALTSNSSTLAASITPALIEAFRG